MITRRAALLGAVTVAAGMPVTSSRAAIRYPLPEGMTREFFRELAADSRKCLESRTLTAFQRDRFALDAEIFERMASQLEPFEALETELWARDRDIMVLHGRAASCNRINYRTGRAIMTVENHADAVREKLGLEKPKVEASAPALPDDMNNLMRKTGFSPASSL